MIPSQGGPAEQVTSGTISDLDATWSPDGKTLAFGQLREEGAKQIYSVQLLDLATRSRLYSPPPMASVVPVGRRMAAI